MIDDVVTTGSTLFKSYKRARNSECEDTNPCICSPRSRIIDMNTKEAIDATKLTPMMRQSSAF